MATGTDAVFQNGTLRMIEQRIEVICVLQRPDPDSNLPQIPKDFAGIRQGAAQKAAHWVLPT